MGRDPARQHRLAAAITAVGLDQGHAWRPVVDPQTLLAVVSEAYGWFLHRMGEQAARQFRELIDALPAVQLLPLDVAHHAAPGRT